MNFKRKKILSAIVTLLMAILFGSLILSAQNYLPRKWNTRKVNLQFNRYYDWNEMEQALRTLEKAYPKFLKLPGQGDLVYDHQQF